MIKTHKMLRTPLLNTLRKAFDIALQSKKNGQPPADELPGLFHHQCAERRRFIGNVVKAGVAITASGIMGGCKKAGFIPMGPANGDLMIAKKTQPKIVIIGGGIAGLNCARKLQKSGYTSTVFEGSSRIGGRMFTKHDILAPGLYTELGGEFIDSNHKDILNLCREFNLGLLDTGSAEESGFVRDSFYINGKFHSEAEVIKAFLPYASRIKRDINSLPDVMTYDDHDATTVRLDNMSIAAYLDSIDMHGFIRKGIETAYLTEYGLETGSQSSINFLYLFSPDTSDGFHIFGSSDEKFKIEGGNQSLTQALYKQLKEHVVMEHKLVKIQERNNDYTLHFSTGNGTTVQVNADVVVCAIPFTLLREAELTVELPAWKRNAIANLGYGTNAKLFLGFKSRIWRQNKHSGYAFTDKMIQTGWDNSWAQPGTSGGYTIYQGGNDGISLGEGTPESQAPQFISQLEQMWPGCWRAYNGKVRRMHWPTNPFTKGSYSCYKTGQYTTIRGAEFKNIRNLYFAGEHCSANFQGFMNGAAETGRLAAKNIIASIKAGQICQRPSPQ